MEVGDGNSLVLLDTIRIKEAGQQSKHPRAVACPPLVGGQEHQRLHAIALGQEQQLIRTP
jgi:hypothetical protein